MHDFDPSKKVIDSWGLAYKNFAHYLQGRPDEEDPCNAWIDRFKAGGSSAKACHAFREAYDAPLDPHQRHWSDANSANEDILRYSSGYRGGSLAGGLKG